MFRFSSSRTCLLCSRASSLLTPSKRQKNTLCHFKTSRACPQQAKTSVQCSGVSSRRSFSVGCTLRESDKNDIDFSQDPEVKKWMKEMQGDFSKENAENEDEKYWENQRQHEDKEHDQKNKECRINSDNAAMQNNRLSKEANDHLEHKPSVKSWAKNISQEFEMFDSKPSPIIYDYHEEQLRREEGIAAEIEEKEEEEIILERGETGVFDVEELVDLLKEQNAKDIAVIQVPQEIKYVSFFVIVSSHSQRHIIALAELVRQIYKLKKHKQDPPLLLEGIKTDWVAMDMGNIALHIMRPESREMYDLETLWTVGSQYDDKCQQAEENLMDKFKIPDSVTGFAASTMSPENKSLV